MFKTKLLRATLMGGMIAAGTAQAGESFVIVGYASAEAMTQQQMVDTRGANHVIRLVLFRTGKAEMPTLAAAEATTRAGSIGGAGKDRPAIVRLLP